MGFFDSFKTAVTNVGGWLYDHSGQIMDVVSGVAKVAKYIPAAEQAEGGTVLDVDIANFDLNDTTPPQLTQFVRLVDAAQNRLVTASEKNSSSMANIELSPKAVVTERKNTIAGLWNSPATLGPDNLPPVKMTQNVAKMLEFVKFPQTITIGNQVMTTAQLVGEAIFANAPKYATSASLEDGSDPYTCAGFEFVSDDKECSIQGCHAYYALPIGDGAPKDVWHGSVHMKTKMSDTAMAKYDQERTLIAQASVIKIAPSIPGAGLNLNIWVVTLKVIWAVAPYAYQLAPIVVDILMKRNSKYVITVNTVDGTTQTVKVNAAPGIAPAQVREDVTNAVQSAMASNPPADASGHLTNVTVINSSITSTSAAPYLKGLVSAHS